MKSIVIVIIMGVVLSAAAVMAHAPSEMDLTYSHDEQMLSIDVAHEISDRDDHYIRKLEIFFNEEKVKDFYFKRQIKITGLDKKYPLKAQEADVITVKAICRKGGTIEEILVVPAADNLEEIKDKK